jgi:hypothetical protein
MIKTSDQNDVISIAKKNFSIKNNCTLNMSNDSNNNICLKKQNTLKDSEEICLQIDYDNSDVDDDEDIDSAINLSRKASNSCCIITSSVSTDSAYSSTTVTSTASSSPKSTTCSLFKLSTDSLTSTFNKYPSGVLNIGYSGKAKITNNEYLMKALDNFEEKKMLLNLDMSEHNVLDIKLNYGDDCSFILSSNNINYFFGIADGVSANRYRGYNAKLFPIALLDECSDYMLNNSIDENERFSKSFPNLASNDILLENNQCEYLYNALFNSHLKVQEKCVYGSSTVCLLSLKLQKNSNALLSTCNLGDSGYMIIRNKSVFFKSQTQSHRYNAPYQLGCTPSELLEHDLYRDK